MKNINWKIRFNRNNLSFIFRFIAAVFIPILIYFGLEVTDLTNWTIVGKVIMDALSNPYVIGLTIFNAVNVLFDPTTKGLSDSDRALNYDKYDFK